MSPVLSFCDTERVALFIDGPHFAATARALELDIDFRKFLDLFRQNATLVRAYYYSVTGDGPEHARLQHFLEWLNYNGFEVVSTPARPFRGSSAESVFESKSYVSFALGVMQLAKTLDHVVLFTGDGNYSYLIRYIQQTGKRVTVVSTLRATPAKVADRLRRQADQFIELADLGPHICRQANPTLVAESS